MTCLGGRFFPDTVYIECPVAYYRCCHNYWACDRHALQFKFPQCFSPKTSIWTTIWSKLHHCKSVLVDIFIPQCDGRTDKSWRAVTITFVMLALRVALNTASSSALSFTALAETAMQTHFVTILSALC